jgi:hypothetical protein
MPICSGICRTCFFSTRPRILDGVAEAKLIALTLSPAPEGFARWSLRLLEEKVVELHIVERASAAGDWFAAAIIARNWAGVTQAEPTQSF